MKSLNLYKRKSITLNKKMTKLIILIFDLES